MKKYVYIALVVMMAVACRPSTDVEGDALMNNGAGWPNNLLVALQLSDNAELRLYEGNGATMLTMMYGNEMQDFVGTGNTSFVRDSTDALILDTVEMAGVDCYIVRTADNSSTYGAETWYIVYPCFREMTPGGPWALYQIPFDLLDVNDVDGDGESEIIHYVCDTNHTFMPADTYRFADGLMLSCQ